MKYNNIVIIENDADDLELFLSAVRDFSDKITYAAYTDYDQAFQTLLLGIVNVDIIFIDINFMAFKAISIIEQLNADKNLSLIPKVLYASPAILKEHAGHIKGIYGYLLKPCSYEQLRNDLQSILIMAEGHSNLEAEHIVTPD